MPVASPAATSIDWATVVLFVAAFIVGYKFVGPMVF